MFPGLSDGSISRRLPPKRSPRTQRKVHSRQLDKMDPYRDLKFGLSVLSLQVETLCSLCARWQKCSIQRDKSRLLPADGRGGTCRGGPARCRLPSPPCQPAVLNFCAPACGLRAAPPNMELFAVQQQNLLIVKPSANLPAANLRPPFTTETRAGRFGGANTAPLSLRATARGRHGREPPASRPL